MALLTIKEVASRLRVDTTTVRRWIQTGVLAAISLPGTGKNKKYRIPQIALDSLLNGQAALVE